MDKKTIVKIVGLILIIFCISGCERKTSDPYPDALTGTWVTQEPRYKDKTLEINSSQIVFGTGENEPNTFFIDRIKKKEQSSNTEWTFFCADMEGNQFEFVILYSPETEDMASITLKNMKTFHWHKVEE